MEEMKEYCLNMLDKDISLVKALFIPTAEINIGAIEVLAKCMNDLLKCGIQDKNIYLYDLHVGMELKEFSFKNALLLVHSCFRQSGTKRA